MRCFLVPDPSKNYGEEGAWISAEGDMKSCYMFMLDSLCERLVQIIHLEFSPMYPNPICNVSTARAKPKLSPMF
jgi:hypothetical protein